MFRKLEHKLFSYMYEKFLPITPSKALLGQADSLASMLPYENSFEDSGREIILLSDGAIGTMWEISPIAHEIESNESLERIVKGIASLFEMIVSERITFQIHYSIRPSKDFPRPLWADEPQNFAQKVMAERIKAIESLAGSPGDRPTLKKTSIYLTLRVEAKERFGLDLALGNETEIFGGIKSLITEALHYLRDSASTVENHFELAVRKPLKRLGRGDLINILRSRLHSVQQKDSTRYFSEKPKKSGPNRIANEIMNGSIEWSRDAIMLGEEDLIEVLSWSSEPSGEYVGMMTELIKSSSPLDCVLNIRPLNQTDDLSRLAEELRGGGDARRERQKREVDLTEDRLAYGEKLLSVSFHILLRNQNVSMRDGKEYRKAREFSKSFSNSTLPVFVEQYAALPIFLSTLPFCYSKKVAGFLRRERRILSGSIGSYLPLYSGSLGVKRFGQLMQSRNGEALWIDHRASETNPHTAVLGSSGGGKSFYVSNYLTSEFALYPDLMVFIIDSITSQENLVKTFGEEFGACFIKPPESFPNVFSGKIDQARLPFLISIIGVAVNLVSEAKLSAPEKVLLSDAILKVYRDNSSFAKEEYVISEDSDSLGGYKKTSGKTRLPRMSQIVDSFYGICDKKNISHELANALREKLLPFFGSGPYSVLFDQEAAEEESGLAVGIYLYDLEHIQGDRVLTTIVSLVIVAEMNRLINDSANKGRPGVLLIDEAGVNLGGASDELVDFVKNAFIRFRKLNIVCKTLTNNLEHYQKLPALKAAWSLSANKIILPIEKDEVPRFRKSQLLQNDYYYDIVGSLVKKNGAYSEFFYNGNAFSGSCTYVPTGYDYWLAINRSEDFHNFETICSDLGSRRATVSLLAQYFPMGVRDERGNLRKLSTEEVKQLCHKGGVLS